MSIPSYLEQLRPRAHARYRSLVLFGSIIGDFCAWLQQRGYTYQSCQLTLVGACHVERWLLRRGCRRLADVSDEDMRVVHHRYRKEPNVGGAARALGVFLGERGLLAATPSQPACFSQKERKRYGDYLRAVRGFARESILRHQRQLGLFLKHLRADEDPSVLDRLTAQRIDEYVQAAAQTNNRFSLQQVIANVRGYLRWRHATGLLPDPLHEGIDSPRCYRQERLPRAWTWKQVMALLRSINRSSAMGHRDFAMLYLATHYGLRSRELVSLTLDDFDWRGRTIRIRQSKTKQTMLLPLTDEAGAVVSRYLQTARPASTRRELFLRARAPAGTLAPTAVHDILESHLRRSGLPLKMSGTHVLRHSFATQLLRLGASTKQIGDALGHRDVESTCVYLRLAVEDVREVALPMPGAGSAATIVPWTWVEAQPRVRTSDLADVRRRHFIGPYAEALRRYLNLRGALGRGDSDLYVLRQWDDFLFRDGMRTQAFNQCALDRWSSELAALNPTVRRNRLRVVRKFLLFHLRDNRGVWVPDTALFPKARPYRPAYILRPEEISRLLTTAERLPVLNCNRLRPEVMKMAFVLLYCCGLRAGELLRLRIRHYDRRQRVLEIHETKFHKSRLVPLHASVARELDRFIAKWPGADRSVDPDQPIIWSGRICRSKNAMTTTGLLSCWRRLCGSVGVRDHQGRLPHVHDLRHSMAVGALHRCYQQGHDPHVLLPKLAIYLGHVTPIYTHHYLQMTPELREAANRRFHASCEQLFELGGVA